MILSLAQTPKTYAKYLSNSYNSVMRQLLQVGEPAQRTAFSVPLWFDKIFLTRIEVF